MSGMLFQNKLVSCLLPHQVFFNYVNIHEIVMLSPSEHHQFLDMRCKLRWKSLKFERTDEYQNTDCEK